MEFRSQRGRIQLVLSGHPIGPDLWINLSGGDRPHVGAVALADRGTVQVSSREGHKEGELAGDLALKISLALHCAVSLSCGIHLDAITPVEIQDVIALSHALADEFIQASQPPQKS